MAGADKAGQLIGLGVTEGQCTKCCRLVGMACLPGDPGMPGSHTLLPNRQRGPRVHLGSQNCPLPICAAIVPEPVSIRRCDATCAVAEQQGQASAVKRFEVGGGQQRSRMAVMSGPLDCGTAQMQS